MLTTVLFNSHNANNFTTGPSATHIKPSFFLHPLRYQEKSIRSQGLQAIFLKLAHILKTFQDLTNLRASEFEGIGQFSGRILNALTSCGVSEAKLQNANEHHRKLNGRRAPGGSKATAQDKVENNEATAGTTHSVSQLGFDNKISHFKKLLATINTEPLYTPNEEDLTVDALTEKLGRMNKVNKQLKNAESVWVQSRIARNEAFNNEETGLNNIAKMAKVYVKSVFLPKSTQYKKLSGLQFIKIK